jgi:hypothetical protein
MFLFVDKKKVEQTHAEYISAYGKKHQFEGFHCLGKVLSQESSISHLTLRRQMKKKIFISVHQSSKAF